MQTEAQAQKLYPYSENYLPATLDMIQLKPKNFKRRNDMKKILTIVCLACAASLTKADVIADWTFENNPVPTGNAISTTENYGVADSGADTSGSSASTFHAMPVDYTAPSGNGSATSWAVGGNTGGGKAWTTGDYWQFSVSTVGYQNIAVTFDQISSSTGPGKFQLEYSTDGTTFNNFGSVYTVLVNASPNSWTVGTPVSTTTYTEDLSSISGLNNDSTVVFRLVDNSTTSAGGGTVASTGTDRIDNFMVESVPEPAAWGAISGLGLIGICGLRTWRERRSANPVA